MSFTWETMGEKSGPKVSFVIEKIRYMGIRSTERRLYIKREFLQILQNGIPEDPAFSTGGAHFF